MKKHLFYPVFKYHTQAKPVGNVHEVSQKTSLKLSMDLNETQDQSRRLFIDSFLDDPKHILYLKASQEIRKNSFKNGLNMDMLNAISSEKLHKLKLGYKFNLNIFPDSIT